MLSMRSSRGMQHCCFSSACVHILNPRHTHTTNLQQNDRYHELVHGTIETPFAPFTLFFLRLLCASHFQVAPCPYKNTVRHQDTPSDSEVYECVDARKKKEEMFDELCSKKEVQFCHFLLVASLED